MNMDSELDQLGEWIAEQAAHLDAAMHRLLTDLREFDERGGWHAQGAMSCAHWLSWRVGWDLVTARDHVRVARKLAGFSAIDDALRRGEVSYSKIRAMLRAATPENETLLLEYAKLMTASQLEKLARQYVLVQRHGEDSNPQVDEQRRQVRRRDTADGMIKIEAVLHPEEAELVWTMLNHAAAQLTRESRPSPSNDSAESLDVPAVAGVPAPAPAIGHTAAPTAIARAVPTVTAEVIGDSAELLRRCPAPDVTATAPTIAMPAAPAATTATTGRLTAHSIYDSADSRDVLARTGSGAPAPATGHVGAPITIAGAVSPITADVTDD